MKNGSGACLSSVSSYDLCSKPTTRCSAVYLSLPPVQAGPAVGVPVIASGGVGNLQHLADGVTQGGADAVLAASIFHYGEFTVRQAKEFMRERGIAVRL